jgi:hypothetical protein
MLAKLPAAAAGAAAVAAAPNLQPAAVRAPKNLLLYYGAEMSVPSLEGLGISAGAHVVGGRSLCVRAM